MQVRSPWDWTRSNQKVVCRFSDALQEHALSGSFPAANLCAMQTCRRKVSIEFIPCQLIRHRFQSSEFGPCSAGVPPAVYRCVAKIETCRRDTGATKPFGLKLVLIKRVIENMEWNQKRVGYGVCTCTFSPWPLISVNCTCPICSPAETDGVGFPSEFFPPPPAKVLFPGCVDPINLMEIPCT